MMSSQAKKYIYRVRTIKNNLTRNLFIWIKTLKWKTFWLYWRGLKLIPPPKYAGGNNSKKLLKGYFYLDWLKYGGSKLIASGQPTSEKNRAKTTCCKLRREYCIEQIIGEAVLLQYF